MTVNTLTHIPCRGNTYCAIPYDLSAPSFYFTTYEEYRTKSNALRNEYGDPVEEFMLDFIDGDGVELFNALRINQATLGIWFDDFECLSEEDRIKAVYLVQYLGYEIDSVTRRLNEMNLFQGTAIDYAHDFIASTGMLENVPEIVSRYFDYASFARDLLLGGEITEIEINGHGFIVEYHG